MAKDFIVAIELGSSKITGIAGKKNLEGSLSILAVVQEDATACIRRGVIYNIDKTITALKSVRERLEAQLHTRVKKVYVGIGGQSIIGVKNVIVKDMPEGTIVTAEMVDELMDNNHNMSYPNKQILDTITLEYKVDASMQIDPVGIPCTHLEGNFLNILWRQTFFKNLNKCFEDAHLPIADLHVAPLTLAESVLAEADRRAGCVLVDLGADTTTVAVYYKNILRHLAVLPIGGSNVTRDITTLQIEDDEAERMKLKYGSAYTDNASIDNDLTYPVGDDRQVESRKFIELVEARIEEIVENVWFQVPQEYVDKLLSGIILTGGGANMRDIEKVFSSYTGVNKVRIAKTVNLTVDATQPEVTAQDGRMNTAISLLARSDASCAGEPIVSGDLFGPSDEQQRIEEMERRKREEEEAEAKKKADEEKKKADEEKKKQRENSAWSKLKKGVTNFLNSVIDEEE